MLMVIFGAGASYDSLPAHHPLSGQPPLESRLPLAKDLFQNRKMFVDVMEEFPVCQTIIPMLRVQERPVERVLEELQTEGDDHPVRFQQLAAIRFYLQVMIRKCQESFLHEGRGITNYKTLVDQIERWRKKYKRVCFVTFNYDTMLEDALPTIGRRIRHPSEYIEHDDYKIFKLHGSISWARNVISVVPGAESMPAEDIARELIERAATLDVGQDYCLIDRPLNVRPATPSGPLFPAIAIPLETKRSFECPDEHLAALKECIPEVTKVLAIGWRGAEDHFLKMLAENRHRPKWMVFAGERAAAQEVVDKLRGIEGLSGEFEAMDGGFTDLASRRLADELLRS
jgi:hypothetical protein